MLNSQAKTILSMGYRRMDYKEDKSVVVYGKPVSTSLFLLLVSDGKIEFRNYFHGAQGKSELWRSEVFSIEEGDVKHGSLLNWIKYEEGYYGKLVPHLLSNFEFLSFEEEVRLSEA